MTSPTNETTAAANAAVQQAVTSADVLAFLREKAAAIKATLPLVQSVSVYANTNSQYPEFAEFDVHLKGVGFHQLASAATIEDAARKAAEKIDTPEKTLAKRREELARMQADVAALEAQVKPVAEAA